MFRLATFNLENLDDRPDAVPPLGERIAFLRPQFQRLRADILCLQEVNARRPAGGETRELGALDRLLAETPYGDFHRVSTVSSSGVQPADRHNLVILSRYPIEQSRQYRHDLVAPPSHRLATAEPPPEAPEPVQWDRPFLHASIRLPGGPLLHVLNLHLRAPLAAFVPGRKQGAFTWNSVAGWAEGFFLSSMKRAGQALEARLLVDRLLDDDPDALIAVCGDLNAEAYEVPTRILRGGEEDTGNGALARRALVLLERSLPPSQRFTMVHNGRPAMLDHLLASRALFGWYAGIQILNEDLGDELVGHRSIRHPPESFHAPVVASFEEPETVD